MRPHGSPAQLEQRRLHALVLLEQGLSPVDVGRRLGVDRRSVRRWKAAARHGGAARLKAIPAPGRPRLPVSAGRHEMARAAYHRFAVLFIELPPSRIVARREAAYSRANARICSAGTPVSAAAHSGVRPAM